MKKKLKKLLIGILLTTFLLIGTLVTLILYPQVLFAKRTDYKNLRIYGNQELNDNYSVIFDNALKLINDAELFDDKLTFDIFLSNNSLYNIIDTKVFGLAMARSIDNNVILKVNVDFENNLLIGPKNKRNLTRTVAHELVHCLQINKYGILKFNPLFPPELWKLEGYPEYIANKEEINSADYRLTNSIKKLKEFEEKGNEWIEIESGQFDPLVYYKGRVMIEYLIDIRNMTYDQILNDRLTGKSVDDEMEKWFSEQRVE